MKKSTLLEQHPLYSLTKQQMLNYQQAYLNGRDFRSQARPKRPNEDELIYRDIIDHTASQPIVRRVVDSINDIVFDPGVKRSLDFVTPQAQDLPPQEWAELFLLDADFNNSSLTAVMEHVSELLGIFGSCWVFVDQAPSLPQRPYVIPISPLLVTNWRTEYILGREVIEQLTMIIHETAEYQRIRHYQLGTQTKPTTWADYVIPRNLAPEAEIVPEKTGQLPPLMGIPVCKALARRDPRSSELGISDCSTAYDIQQEHYRIECEIYLATQFARTLIRADVGIKVPAATGAIVRALEGQVEAINIQSQDITVLSEKQEQLIRRFEALSGLPSQARNNGQVQSGISIIEERRQTYRRAGNRARLLEIVEESIWTLAARYQGQRWAGEIEYSRDYENHDTAYTLAIMEKITQMLPNNPLIERLITREAVRLLAPEYEQSNLLDQLEIVQEEDTNNTTPHSRDLEDLVKPEENSQSFQLQITDNQAELPTSASPIEDQLLQKI